MSTTLNGTMGRGGEGGDLREGGERGKVERGGGRQRGMRGKVLDVFIVSVV